MNNTSIHISTLLISLSISWDIIAVYALPHFDYQIANQSRTEIFYQDVK